jgi:transcription termination factor Rho
MPIPFAQLQALALGELVERATQAGVPNAARLRRTELVFAIAQKLGAQENTSFGMGVLEVHAEGFGFLRAAQAAFLPGPDDIYVSQSQIRRFHLQTGDTVIGVVRPPKEGERYPALLRVETINGEPPGDPAPAFDTLTAIYPDDRLNLSTRPALRTLDWVAPLGLGQRALLVAPAGTGRTELLRELVEVFTADEDLETSVLLVGERPEDIAEWKAGSRAEILATGFDDPPARQVQLADIAFERARRLAERGDDVVLVVDSLSRLLRACMAEIPATGREFNGVDVSALHRLRRYLGAARALEEGGSLTVIGTLTGDGDSRIDRALREELSEAANWTVTLSRALADRGLRPPIDARSSGTLRPERLLTPAEVTARTAWRRGLTGDPLEDLTSAIEASQS